MVPLLVQEPMTSSLLRLLREDSVMPSLLEFVCLDERLSLAAQREGFNVVSLALKINGQSDSCCGAVQGRNPAHAPRQNLTKLVMSGACLWE